MVQHNAVGLSDISMPRWVDRPILDDPMTAYPITR
jgi:hypothetical protein